MWWWGDGCGCVVEVEKVFVVILLVCLWWWCFGYFVCLELVFVGGWVGWFCDVFLCRCRVFDGLGIWFMLVGVLGVVCGV